ncbi:F-box domain-containing protein [Mycena indigotica]|uniref:F-box domain-containing protein n=1 Tax=Mycena indigotica TaxID=2126181 RepID=A0A8H6RX31_9AGAR|nr:F-box domain-containing protein [Mycena indigotica]KAF7288889.1 F-box domain-containing protein [Mycena indigotica]
MESRLAGLPQDLLLELAKWLDIRDLFSLLSTCSVIRNLQWHKALWIYAIWRLRTVQLHPLPLQHAQDLAALSLEQLVDAVKVAHRLLQNLHSPEGPVPVFTTQFHAGWLIKRVICIPGTYLALVESYSGISCWDLLTSQSVASLPKQANVGLLPASSSVCMDTPGKALVIGCVQPRLKNIQHLAAIWLDFTDRSNVTLTIDISPDVSNVSYPWRYLFASKEGIGLVTTSHLIYWVFETDAVIVQPHDHPLAQQSVILAHFRHGDYLYVSDGGTSERGPMLDVIDLSHLSDHGSPGEILRLEQILTCSRVILPPLDFPDPPDGLFGTYVKPPIAPLAAPCYGVFSITCLTYEDHLTRSCVLFWPSDIGEDARLVLGRHAPKCFQHVSKVRQCAVGSSGRYALLLGYGDVDGDTTEATDYLALLHLPPDAESFEFRRLDVGDIMLGSVVLAALDDTLGLVVLLDHKGMLMAISYART